MLHERGNTQRLSQQVSWLLLSVNGKDINQSRLDPFTEVVVFLVDMTSARTHLGRLGEVDGTSIIFKEFTVHSRYGGGQFHPMLFHLFRRFIKTMAIRRLSDRPTYLLSEAEKTTSVCSLKAHVIGHP
jgi:hypothetical protein